MITTTSAQVSWTIHDFAAALSPYRTDDTPV